MSDESGRPLTDLIDRLERERRDADSRYNDALTTVDRAILTDAPSLAAVVGHLKHFESLLVQYLQTITAYVDTKDRSIGGSELRERLALAEQRLSIIKRELPVPGAATPTGEPVPAQTVDAAAYVSFEDRFRGSEYDIRTRLEAYLPILTSASDVVDVGCGRGELLALLTSGGVRARGADTNAAMVEICRSRGLDVEQADAVSFIGRQVDGSVGALVAIQVVEHMDPGYLLRFLDVAYRKMRRGAPLVLETINPACWMAFFETYLRDPTHRQPLHPDTLRYLVRSAGFTSADIQYMHPVRDVDQLERVPTAVHVPPELTPLVDTINSHADKLNARIFWSMDYAVVARR